MKFLLDMGISARVGSWLREKGHDVSHISEVGVFDLPDDQIIEKAIGEARIILTADMDFGHILAFRKINAVSVIQFRLSNFTPHFVINKMIEVLSRFEDYLNQEHYIITVEDAKIRVRKLPI